MKIHYKKKSINIPVKKVSYLGEGIGLMFHSKNTNNLLFEFNKQSNMKIHSIFVFFDFLAIWLNEKNKVIGWKVVKPFTPSVSPKKSFSKLIEVPINDKNRKISHFFDGKGKV
jgi:uncharacterized membrane protein (UPF0127 family)